MDKLKESVLASLPEIQFEEGQFLTLVVAPDNLRKLAGILKSEGYDYLIHLTGVDDGDALGVVYLLCQSSDLTKTVVMKTSTTDRENPFLPTVSDLWATALLNEREVYGFLGIRFIDHPDMRHLFLTERWKGFPLRKDYNADRSINPVDSKSYEMNEFSSKWVQTVNGVEERRYQLFDEDDYVINFGPQHPATHGVLHFRIALDGEIINKIDVNCGYIHRGIEKLSESLTYPQILHFTDRLDYLSSHINRHALCMCIEKAASIEVPERAEYIRTIMDELTRIASHLLSWACMCMDMGALTAFIYGMRDREKILDIFEASCGGRLITNYNVIGGVMQDIHPDFQKDVKAFIQLMRKNLKEYNTLYTGNVIAKDRMIGVGVLSKETAVAYGVTGPVGRASGLSCDLRKIAPYSVYDQVEFKEIIRHECDSFARYLNRLDEITESLNIIEQLIDRIPEGAYCTKTKPIIKLPEGEYYQRIEAARGEFGVYIKSKGDKNPYRVKFRSPSMTLVSIMDAVCHDAKIADLVTIGGSMDYVIPDIDR